MVTITPDITTAIWDLDGTLLNSFTILESLIGEIAPELGVAVPTREALQRNFHGSLRDTFDNVFRGHLSREDIDTFEMHFLTRQDGHYDTIEEHLLSDAVDLAARLAGSGITQLLVTNRNHKEQGRASPRSIVERSLLNGYMDHVICGDDSEFRKPDRRVVAGLLSDLDVAGHEMVVIGDQYVDAQLALNLGSSAIIVARDGVPFAHDKLADTNWQQHITIVESFHDVHIDIPQKRDV